MATKKSATKTNKATAKRAPAKRATTRKVTQKKSMKSFRLAKESRDFKQMKFSDDTLHWIIIGAVIVLFAFWIASINITVNDIYNELQNLTSL